MIFKTTGTFMGTVNLNNKNEIISPSHVIREILNSVLLVITVIHLNSYWMFDQKFCKSISEFIFYSYGNS